MTSCFCQRSPELSLPFLLPRHSPSFCSACDPPRPQTLFICSAPYSVQLARVVSFTSFPSAFFLQGCGGTFETLCISLDRKRPDVGEQTGADYSELRLMLATSSRARMKPSPKRWMPPWPGSSSSRTDHGWTAEASARWNGGHPQWVKVPALFMCSGACSVHCSPAHAHHFDPWFVALVGSP